MLCIYVGCFACFSFGATPSRIVQLPPLGLGMLLFCAGNTLVGYGAFSNALHHWEASRVSAVLSLTPLATLGFTVLGATLAPEWIQTEPVSAWTLAGAATVVGGSLLGARRTTLNGPNDARDDPQHLRRTGDPLAEQAVARSAVYSRHR
jgi:drug/metabolite transporter (DMT)-like permease